MQPHGLSHREAGGPDVETDSKYLPRRNSLACICGGFHWGVTAIPRDDGCDLVWLFL